MDRQQAVGALQKFLTGHRAIALDAARRSRLMEAFTVHLPLWVSWVQVMAWLLGEKKIRQNDRTVYKPREVKLAQEMTWNAAACDVGEFGVASVPFGNQPLEPFNPDILHETGLVFEPVGSVSEARAAAEQDFSNRIRQKVDLDRISQSFIRAIRQRFGLMYYPLWVLRYVYRGRSFQVAVDGFSGQVLYGKAPGNSLFRAAVLVAGMALGAFLSIDAAAVALYLAFQAGDDATGFLLFVGLGLFVAGIGLMLMAYRRYRYGEYFEFTAVRSKTDALFDIRQVLSQVEEISSWIDR
jgi:hypothetical protein